MKLLTVTLSVLLSLFSVTSFADVELDPTMICQGPAGEKLTLYTYYNHQVSNLAELSIGDQSYIGVADNVVDQSSGQTKQTMSFQSKDGNVTGVFINDSSDFAGGVQFKDSRKVLNFQNCYWNDLGGGSVSVHN